MSNTIDGDARGNTALVLGSASPRREALLRQAGAEFIVRAAATDETLGAGYSPGAYVSELAKRKSAAVSEIMARDIGFAEPYDRIIVIGADTVVVTDGGEIFGKPADRADAKRMLGTLSGRWHEVYTGVALTVIKNAKRDKPDTRPAALNTVSFARAAAPGGAGKTDRYSIVKFEKTRVKMRELDDEAIEAYIDTGEPDDKAGAYAVQGVGSLLIERVEGCYYNVVGLPLSLLGSMLGDLGYNLLKKKT